MSFRSAFLRLIGDYRCDHLVEVVTDYLEGTMPARERRRFERHLKYCDGCEHYLAQMRRTIEVTGRLRAEDLDALPADARANLLQAFAAYCQER